MKCTLFPFGYTALSKRQHRADHGYALLLVRHHSVVTAQRCFLDTNTGVLIRFEVHYVIFLDTKKIFVKVAVISDFKTWQQASMIVNDMWVILQKQAKTQSLMNTSFRLSFSLSCSARYLKAHQRA